jgi:thymidine kinase
MYEIPLCGSLEVICGSMFSSKTSLLLQKMSPLAVLKRKIVYVNSSLDTRAEIFSSHNPLFKSQLDSNIKTLKARKLSELRDTLVKYDVLCIDEGQFFPDLYDEVKLLVDQYKKRVIVAGLDGDRNRKPFGDMIRLIPIADSVTKLHAFCMRCAEHGLTVPAPFTGAKSAKKDDTEVKIGGAAEYEALCRECYLKGAVEKAETSAYKKGSLVFPMYDRKFAAESGVIEEIYKFLTSVAPSPNIRMSHLFEIDETLLRQERAFCASQPNKILGYLPSSVYLDKTLICRFDEA